MATQVLVNEERAGISVRGAIHTSALPKDTIVKIYGDNAFDIAGSGDIPVGHISITSPTGADNQGTVQTKYNKRFKAKCSGALAAGTEVQMAAPSGTESVIVDLSSSSRARCVGIVIVGAADGGYAEVLGY